MDTHNISHCNPFVDNQGNSFNRLLVRVTEKRSIPKEGEVITPETILNPYETGVITYVSPDSLLNVGDEVVYVKTERNAEQFEGVVLEGHDLECIYENELWSVNDIPYNRLFVAPDEDMESMDGIMLPNGVKGLPQKGTVHSAPTNSHFKAGDRVQYRKQENGIYPTVNMDGKLLDVLWEADIFTVNDKVAPHRMIVQINLIEQGLKRNASAEGVSISPLYQFMRYNLQYGKVIEIGEEAQKHYPELNAGDYAILHHTVESQPYRVLSYKKNKHNVATYEYRMINAFDPRSREIFGIIKGQRANGRWQTANIIPFGENVFLKWRFNMVQQSGIPTDIAEGQDLTFDNCHDLDTLHTKVNKKKEIAVKHYGMVHQSHILQLQQLDPAIPENEQLILAFHHGIEENKRNAERVSNYVNQNHLVETKIVKSNNLPTLGYEVAATYRELYPINILDQNFLITHERFIYLLKHTSTMAIKAYGPRLLVRPVKKEETTAVIIPDASKETPTEGVVISAGNEVESIKDDATIHYKSKTGYPVTLEGEEYIILHKNDVLLVK